MITLSLGRDVPVTNVEENTTKWTKDPNKIMLKKYFVA